MKLSAVQLGRVPYSLGLALQDELIAARKEGRISDTLLLLEHPPVVTLGRNAKARNVLASAEQLKSREVEIFECNRGGDVTFHGPGQLVGYPIVDLFGFKPRIGAVEFVRKLEEVLIRTCAAYGIAAQRIPGLTGVWTRPQAGEPAKIAAIGVHISRGVTSHGFALNVSTDLAYFQLIVPCGIQDKSVTSIEKELGRAVELAEVGETAARQFGSVFGEQVLWTETVEALLGRSVGVPLRAPAGTEAGGEDVWLA
ncbi:MAG TPA: lipoyl(octanoyl) transferase LipB [Terriglobales bacterium]|nr:lipoyl(octanoyl) transferase LipB [Terriglobales bacterium]